MSRTLRSMPVSITVEEIEALVDRVFAANPESPKGYAYMIARNEGIDRLRRTRTVLRRARALAEARKLREQKEKALRVWEQERDAVLQDICHLKRTIPAHRYYHEHQRYLDIAAHMLRGEKVDYPSVSKDVLYQWRRRSIVFLRERSVIARRFYERYYANGRRFGRPPKESR